MKANRVIKPTGASLLLAAVLVSSGIAPALAETDTPVYTQPVPFDPPFYGQPVGPSYPLNPDASSCTPTVVDGTYTECSQPLLSITQAGTTAGARVLLEGSGFTPGEQITIKDWEGRYSLTTVADGAGSFRYDWAVPSWASSGNGLVMLSAIGTASQHETASVQVQMTAAYISDGDVWGTLKGWYPGEELTITMDQEYYQTAYASAEGTSSNFDELALTITKGVLVEVHGSESGGYYGAFLVPFNTGPGPQPPLQPAPVEEVFPEPSPVEPETVEPVIKTAVEVPIAEPPIAEPPVVKAPAPTRPQPQAALVSAGADEAGPASVVTALLAGPVFLVLALIAGPGVLISGAASAAIAASAGLLVRRLSTNDE